MFWAGGEIKMVYVTATLGVPEEVERIAKHLGIDVEQETDVNTKVVFQYYQVGDRRFIDLSMEI